MDNAFNQAVKRGSPYHNHDGGRSIEGVWYSCFWQVPGQDPRLYVGYDHNARKWRIFQEGKLVEIKAIRQANN